ncbi:MAG: kynureninase, partial [Gemmatimonadetes bacterium]|nr:kynureninase [Gemmatimonadota bacterium]
MSFEPTLAYAQQLDAQDTLAHYAERFYRRPGQIYLDGNSLGLLSQNAEASVLRVLEQWKTLGIDGWTEASPPWFTLAEILAEGVAPLIGASAEETIVTNSTTVNLHQLVATLWDPSSPRTVLLADDLNFPSDLYALQSQLTLRGLDPARHLTRVRSRDGLTLDEADIIAAMSDDVQMLVLPSVVYTSGQLLDIARVT